MTKLYELFFIFNATFRDLIVICGRRTSFSPLHLESYMEKDFMTWRWLGGDLPSPRYPHRRWSGWECWRAPCNYHVTLGLVQVMSCTIFVLCFLDCTWSMHICQHTHMQLWGVTKSSVKVDTNPKNHKRDIQEKSHWV